MNAKIFDSQTGKESGEVALPESIFAQKANPHLLHEVVRWRMSKSHQGTHDSKTRAEVSGGGKKPWKQKGSGRARAGSNRSPLWRKGGTIFGPHPRDYSFQMPKKKLRAALHCALSQAASSGRLCLLKDFHLESTKTKEAVQILSRLGTNGQKVLLVLDKIEENQRRSCRNISALMLAEARHLGVYDVLGAEKVFMTQAALEIVSTRGGVQGA